MSYKKAFMELMVQSNVLTFGEFTLKSGRIAPYFVNTGNYETGMQAAKLGEFYADCIMERGLQNVDALFGPAYKGIPLSVATAIALYNKYGVEVNYCFNRKEAKDHGEGGTLVGYQLKDGDKVLIIEDVVTAGTAMAETVPLLKALANVEFVGLVISVDRMERGKNDCSAVQEIQKLYGIPTYPIVTTREIIDTLYGVEINGKVVIDEPMKQKMEQYLAAYGV